MKDRSNLGKGSGRSKQYDAVDSVRDGQREIQGQPAAVRQAAKMCATDSDSIEHLRQPLCAICSVGEGGRPTALVGITHCVRQERAVDPT